MRLGLPRTRTRTWPCWLLLALLALTGCTASQANRDEPACADRVAAEQATVHTTHRLSASDLPGVGDYPDAYWQLRQQGIPCGRAPGPTDWAYQDLLVLGAPEVAALAEAWTWAPTPAPGPTPSTGRPTPADVWPALAAHIPVQARWRHSDAYDKAAALTRSLTVYLDPDRRLMLVFSFDR